MSGGQFGEKLSTDDTEIAYHRFVDTEFVVIRTRVFHVEPKNYETVLETDVYCSTSICFAGLGGDTNDIELETHGYAGFGR